MNDGTEPARGLLSGHSNYLFERNVDDRRRLEHQFGLLREDFNLWFDEALRLGGLSTDPGWADWSVLDVGCGEGLFTCEITRRYPKAQAVGVDVDATAVAAASARSPAAPNMRFLVHDARQPVPSDVRPVGGFDAAVMWMVLPYLPDRRSALANLAAAVRPGGVVLLGNVPDEALRLDHPAAEELLAAGRQLVVRVGLAGLEGTIGGLLHEVGFDEVATEVLRYPMGGATSYGQRWHAYMLMSMSAAKAAIVDVFGLMDEAEYDRRFERLAAEPVLGLWGEVRFLVTVARRR
ncbi:MAG TPA: class I SAM-dependent methyltransferase [Micromonosporaceae bacterium]|nr:class I SAM-dependent methyltransferase [Micromonosporaceae bacterium]